MGAYPLPGADGAVAPEPILRESDEALVAEVCLDEGAEGEMG